MKYCAGLGFGAALVAGWMSMAALAVVSPASVSTTLPPGGSLHVDKTVDVPDFPPKLDVCLIVDLSGSYNNDLPNIKSLAPGIFDAVQAGVLGGDVRFGLATFVDYPFNPWGGTTFLGTDYAYRLEQALTATKATWVAAVNAMSTLAGFDGPESQYEAIFQAVTGAGRDVGTPGPSPGDVGAGQACGFSPGRSSVIILTTDAPFHNQGDGGGPFPYPGPSQAQVITALQTNNVTFIGLKAPGSTGQMDTLAGATGGAVVSTTNTSSDIADAILQGLQEIVVTVEPNVTPLPPSTACTVDISFDPTSQDIDPPEGGATVDFEELIEVPAGITGADLVNDMVHCNVQFTGNGGDLGSQEVWITVKYEPTLDIKFCSNPNGFNSKRMTGVVPFTLFGGEGGLDVADIDVSSLRLMVPGGPTGSFGPLSADPEDRGRPSDAGASQCAIDPATGAELRTLNPDGIDDLEITFGTDDVCLLVDCNAFGKGDTIELKIVGKTNNGISIMTSIDVLDVKH